MTSNVNLPFSNLRAVVILIVVAFHSALPYLASQPAQPFAFDAEPYRWIAFPIIDHERWFGLALALSWLTSAGAGAIVRTVARTPSRRPSAISHEGVVADRT